MTDKEEINAELRKVFSDENFVMLWWSLKLPGLGNEKPINILEQNPDLLLDYVKGYATPGLDVDAGIKGDT